MKRPSTGVPALDELLGGLGVGDNVVWQASSSAEVEPFLHALLADARGEVSLAWLSFRLPPATLLDRFADVWDDQRFILLDGWTGEPPAGRGGRSLPGRVRRLKDPADADQVNRELAEVEERLGPGALYVFDDLTTMQRLWGLDAALALFLRCCPRLYEQRTVAYWALERDAHPPAFLSRLADVTQVVLDLEVTGDGSEGLLRVTKADGHPADVPGRTLRYRATDQGIEVVQHAGDVRRRIAEQVRAQRIAAGMSQAELARRIGVTPSALSQFERGRHGFSGETLTRLWATLGVPFGPGSHQGPAPYRLARRGARQPIRPVPGLAGEIILADHGGLAAYLLTAEPATSGRRPFETKQPELVLILEGVLELQLGQTTHTLQQGDAIQLLAQPLTGWRNPAREPTRLLWLLL